MKDVASDRPDHWKSSSVVRVKSVESRKAILPDPKRQKSRLGTTTTAPLKVVAAPSSSSSKALSFSFQPSWMQSAAPSSSSCRSSVDCSVIEDISEDVSDIYTHPPAVEDDWAQPPQETFTAPDNTGYGVNTPVAPGGVLSTPQRTPGMGVGFSQAGHVGGAGSSHLGSSGGSGRKYSSTKARPGTIKAKYQKVMRDADAGENRMLSIPPTHVAVAREYSVPYSGMGVDLQDPRSRARLVVDIEMLQVLPERSTAPFKGAKGVVLFTHRVVKPSAGLVSPVTTPIIHSTPAGIACVAEGEDVVPAAESVLGAIVEEGNRVTPPEGMLIVEPSMAKAIDVANDEAGSTATALMEGVQCIVYFKQSTCTGSGRGLRDGLTARIYDPEIVRGSGGSGVISTLCWEPVSGYTRINSL